MKTYALCRYAICQGLEEFGLGARELRRALRGFLEDPIAFSILKHQAVRSFLQFRPAKRVASCQVDPGGSVEKVSWKNPKKMDSFNSLT